MSKVLHDKKWFKFLSRARLFRHLPFIEFVLGSGSLAIGRVSPDSDFDVVVGVKRGRIFTARFLAVLVFGFLGWRRKRLHHDESASDKICLNHFVAPSAYRLAPPHTDSWRELYKKMVPVWGDKEKLNEFFAANNPWVGEEKTWIDDMRFDRRPGSSIKYKLENMLSGPLGELVESWARRFQLWKIRRSLAAGPVGYKPRLRYNDEELEFHPDRKKFENF
jgi:hypothetical protein